MKTFLTHIILVCVVWLAMSCGEDRTYEYEEKTQHNHWMYEEMQDKYLWADAMTNYKPAWKDFFATPSKFLSTLTAKSGHSDSWSYLELDTLLADSHERGYFNHINSYGIDFLLMTDPTGRTTHSVLRVLTVYPDSPAETAGLVRGDFICSFDSYKLSSSNVSKLQKGVGRSLEVRHLAQDETDGSFYWRDTVTVTMDASRYVEDVAFPICRVLDVEGVKIGYLMCTRLLEYPVEQGEEAGSKTVYRDELTQKMHELKAAGVEEMVLDLRLCNDGTLSMARQLASHVVAPSGLSSTFAQTFWNQTYEANNVTLPYDQSVENLGLSRIYILTDTYTQGASEWLIHSLQCTMGEDNVILVGQNTKGQDVMTQEVAYQYGVHLIPAVAYVADADGDYDYGSLAPTFEVDETDYLDLAAYGDPSEILLNTAIQHIFGLIVPDEDASEEEDGQNGSEPAED